MSNHLKNKPSFSVEKLLPVLENENFPDFLRAYYEWMESCKVTISDSSGSFSLGENILGSTSNILAKIKHIGDNYLVLQVQSELPFEILETIRGQTSGVTATVTKIEDNILRKANNLVHNKTFEYASGEYYEYLKAELTRGIPSQTETDRRLLAEKIRQFYLSKSTEDAYRFLFKTVYNDDVIFRFPGDEILRVSDGKFEKTAALRASTVYDAGEGDGPQSVDVISFLNKTVRGRTSNAVANIIDVSVTFLGGIEFAQLTPTLISGEFLSGEEIFDVDNPDLVTTLYGVISSVTVIDGGSGYSVGDSVTISGDGFEASANVSSINSSGITKISVDSVGHGYRLGTRAVVDNTSTGGTGLVVEVTGIKNTYEIGGYTVGEISEITILNRGEDYFAAPTLTLEDTVISAIGALSAELITITDPGDDYDVGDALVFNTALEGTETVVATGIVASVTPSSSTSEFSFEDDFNLTLEGEDGILINDGPLVFAGDFVEGATYIITSVGTTDFTLIGSADNNPSTSFTATASGLVSAGDFVATKEYTIQTLGDTDWNVAAGTTGVTYNVGDVFTAAAVGSGTGTASQGTGAAIVDGLGPISRIELTDFGAGYSEGALPTISVTTSTGSNALFAVTKIQGTSAAVTVDATSGLGLGSIREIEVTNFGVDYSTATATVSGGDNNAVVTPVVSGIGISSGQFLTTDGLVGVRIIQDSLFFQDFSYVIRSGIGFNTYRDVIKDSLHPAGMEFFGEILISSLISVAANFTSVITQPRPSQSTVFLEELASFTPDVSSTIKLLKEIVSAMDYGIAPIVSTVVNNYTYQIEIAPTPINVEPSVSLTIEFLNYEKAVVQISSIIHTPPATQITFAREINQQIDIAVRIVDPFGPTTGELFGNLPISLLALDQISTYKFKKFSDPYDVQRPMYRQSLITGTVSTSGTTVTGNGTSFDTEFVTGEFIIIDEEKFVITSINSPTELIVNVVPTGTYSNVAALREYLL